MYDKLALIYRLRRLLKVSNGELFKLASGGTSRYYLDVRPAALNPRDVSLIAAGFLSLMRVHFTLPGPTMLAGVALGGCPLATATSMQAYLKQELALNVALVRKEPKDHGTGKLVECGVDLDGTSGFLLEDVVTTGTSSVRAAMALEAVGFEVRAIFAVVDRRDPDLRQPYLTLPESNVKFPFYSLVTLSDIVGDG